MIGWVRGGRIGALAQRRFHAVPLLGIAALLVLLARMPWMPREPGGVLVSAGYLTALVMLWGNRDRPWFPLLIAGTALNTLVILVNGGWMPIVPAALAGAGEPLPSVLANGRVMIEVDPRHILAGRGTPLAVLGDSIPLRFGGIGAVVSPGDLLMAAGIAGFLQAAMRAVGSPGQRV